MTIGLIVGAIAGALEGGLAETDYDSVTSPRKIVDHCLENRGYKIFSNFGKGA